MLENTDTINKATRQQQSFLLSEKPETLEARFFGLHVHQVPIGERWLIYKDGALIDQLNPGRHRWWGEFFHKWETQRVDTRIKLMDHNAVGRIRGPLVPQDASRTADASGTNLACEVKASLRFSVQLKNVETFLQFTEPVSVFHAALHDLVIEYISQLPYDQYGNWATTLRDNVRSALLGGRYNVEQRIGLNITDVFVVKFEPSTTHDRQILAMYQLIERGKRELVEAMDNRKRDIETANSFAEQGAVLGIAPSILKLQDSPIGKALIEQDAKLRELIIASGLNPGVNIQPLQENPYQVQGYQPASNVYLTQPAANVAQIGPSAQTPFQPQGPNSGSLPPYGNEITGTLIRGTGQTGPISPSSAGQSSGMPTSSSGWNTSEVTQAQTFSSAPQPSGAFETSDMLAVDETRQSVELDALTKAEFNVAGRGQINSATNEWTLMVYKRRPVGILTIAFTCPPGYPNKAPLVQVRTSASSGYSSPQPNSIHNWLAHHLLVDVAQEILNSTP